MRWQLFVRPNCFLCAEAVQIIVQAGIVAERLDVDSRADWQQEYGQLVPVLYDSDLDRELVYPFDVVQLQQFCQIA